MQVVAPAAARVFVTEPGGHCTHASTGLVLKVPSSHSSQTIAALLVRAPSLDIVVDPSEQVWQLDCPLLPWYCPAPHAVHSDSPMKPGAQLHTYDSSGTSGSSAEQVPPLPQ